MVHYFLSTGKFFGGYHRKRVSMSVLPKLCRYVQTSYRTVSLISMAPTGNKLVPSPNPNP